MISYLILMTKAACPESRPSGIPFVTKEKLKERSIRLRNPQSTEIHLHRASAKPKTNSFIPVASPPHRAKHFTHNLGKTEMKQRQITTHCASTKPKSIPNPLRLCVFSAPLRSKPRTPRPACTRETEKIKNATVTVRKRRFPMPRANVYRRANASHKRSLQPYLLVIGGVLFALSGCGIYAKS